MIEQGAAQALLNRRCRAVGNHHPPIFEHAAQHHDESNGEDRPHQLSQRRSGKNLCNQPSQQCQPRHADAGCADANDRRVSDAPANALGKMP